MEEFPCMELLPSKDSTCEESMISLRVTDADVDSQKMMDGN